MIRRGAMLVGVAAAAAAAVIGFASLCSWLALPGVAPAVADPRLRPACAAMMSEGAAAQAQVAPARAAVAAVTSAALLNCPRDHDGVLVQLRGEIVGPAIDHPSGERFVRLDDATEGVTAQPRGGNAGVTVVLTASQSIEFLGGPGVRGDRVAVIGRFHRVDTRTGEVAVVRAEDVTVLEPGRALVDPPVGAAGVVGPALAALAAAVWLPVLRRRR